MDQENKEKTADAELLEALSKEKVFQGSFLWFIRERGFRPFDLATASDERKRELAKAIEIAF